jgi:cation transport protein ChaC
MQHLGDDGLPPYPPPRPWPQAPALESPLWVFGYGSLIWHPGFPWRESCVGRVYGHHRALCVWSWVYRGTVQLPGLVLGLDRGGSCTGVAYRVGDEHRDATVAYLLRRELTTEVYRPETRQVVLDDGRRVNALTFLVDRRRDQYAGCLPPEQVARVVARASGRRGRNTDYVRNTVAHLEELGIPCRRLRRVVYDLHVIGA